ncbi:hypothetical protein NPIL_227591 [Nephila pilipes]|uniref:Uncharacterized protein n=1 Tax=Nephila pilipes TaxID=299642 RepID=A0A8X6N7M5_NEPPI|nr:hypothetical protein NPIL_227591 [Nephila pilipes]
MRKVRGSLGRPEDIPSDRERPGVTGGPRGPSGPKEGRIGSTEDARTRNICGRTRSAQERPEDVGSVGDGQVVRGVRPDRRRDRRRSVPTRGPAAVV